jgi:hypothetical protein
LFGVERLQPVLLVEIVSGIRDKSFEAVFLDPLADVFRKQVSLVLVISDKV